MMDENILKKIVMKFENIRAKFLTLFDSKIFRRKEYQRERERESFECLRLNLVLCQKF